MVGWPRMPPEVGGVSVLPEAHTSAVSGAREAEAARAKERGIRVHHHALKNLLVLCVDRPEGF